MMWAHSRNLPKPGVASFFSLRRSLNYFIRILYFDKSLRGSWMNLVLLCMAWIGNLSFLVIMIYGVLMTFRYGHL